MREVLDYLNPLSRLGYRTYSYRFPFIVTVGFAVILELYIYFVDKNPNDIGLYAIFVFIGLIIYFSFRDGIRGGCLTAGLTVLYYFYIIYSRHYRGAQMDSGVETTIILGVLYFLIAGIIGWLKQTIDGLIERETIEKRRLQAIVDQLPVGVLVADKNGKIELSNKQVDVLVGKERSQRLKVGTVVADTRSDRDPDNNPRHWPILQALSTGKSVTNKEFVLNREDGKQLYLQVSASVIHNVQGKIIAAASIINDITEQKELESRKDDFVNMASHELKTPITSMKLYLDSLSSRIKPYHDERAERVLTNIKNQTNRLQKLVNDLLDVSRLQTGKLSFTKETTRIDALVADVIEGIQPTTTQEIIFAKRTPITITCDTFRIYQVLTNLLTNAIKYSSQTGKITVKVVKDNGKAVISVHDTGIGIAKDQQKKIFERLYQVTDDTEKTFPGFGMGLYIAKEIITRHHGRTWVESEKGKGSTFFISLPIQTRKKS